MTKVYYINAPAASGKTYYGSAWMVRKARRGRKIILVQPTTKLVAETIEKTFPAQGVEESLVTEITGRTHGNGVVKGIIDHLTSDQRSGGEILVITHAAFVLLAGIFKGKGRRKWMVVIDEALNVHKSFSLNLPDTHSMVTKHCSCSRDHKA